MDAATVHRRRWLILAVLSLCLVISGLDALVIAMAVPSVQTDLNATVGQMQWSVDAYTLTFGGLLLLAGVLADRFGHKLVLLTGLAVMLAFSVGAALSGSADTLILSRAGMGLGAALVMPATLAIIKHVFPPEEQTKAIAIWSGAAGMGIPLGPVIGGLLLNHFWWGSIFLINVPVVGLALLGGALLIPTWRNPKRVSLDLVGAVLSVLGLVSLVYGLIEVPANGWGSAATVAWLVGGLVLLGAFVVWENRAANAMLPMELFRNRRFSGSAAALTCQAFALFGSLFVITQYFQLARQYDPLPAGFRLLAIVSLIITSPLAPKVVEAIGDKLTIIIGLLVIAAGGFLLSTAEVSDETTVLIGLGIMGLGIGLSIPPSVDGILSGAPSHQAGTASAVNDTALQVGGAISVAVLGSVMTTSYRHALDSTPGLTDAQQHAARDSLGSALGVAKQLGQGGADLVANATHAFGSSVSSTSVTSACVALFGALAAAVIMPARSKKTAEDTDAPTLDVAAARPAETGVASKLAE
ncbi:MFS transporter [Kitasatospora sp. NPDC051170]|uniref:MFS transporter n=1 Tax=Kitasatospora sp. NPDC051170 TaxID=3364056 RepID=UPI0037BA5FEE